MVVHACRVSMMCVWWPCCSCLRTSAQRVWSTPERGWAATICAVVRCVQVVARRMGGGARVEALVGVNVGPPESRGV